jgi:hypothetical protein
MQFSAYTAAFSPLETASFSKNSNLTFHFEQTRNYSNIMEIKNANRIFSLSSIRFYSLILTLLFACSSLTAQVGPPNSGTALAGTTAYTYASSSGTYTAITGGTVYQSGTMLNTDAVSAAVNIGFDFRYNNRSYSAVRISNNGFITFGVNTVLPTTYTGLSTNVNPAPEGVIAGFAANLRASAVVGAAPEIRYETSGATPNRTFVVQYQDVAILTSGTTQRLNFQIRLSETSNVVAIMYGTAASGATTSTGQVGLKGAESSDLSNRTGTNWISLTSGTSATSTCSFGTTNGTTVPSLGLTLNWTPGATWSPATYAPLPYLNDFATWSNGLNTGDSPGSNVRTWPSRGDNSWRSSNNGFTGFTSAVGWTSVNGATATFATPAISPAARFHDFDVSAGCFGDMDFYLDMSSSPIGLYNISFFYNNPTGADVLQIWYSPDGGATFTQLGANIGTAGNNWSAVSRLTGGSATSVIRLRAIGSFGNDDIFLDNFRVDALTCAPPTALLYTPSSATGGTLFWTNPTAGTPENYNYEIRTSGAAGSGATGLIASGTVANPTNSASILLGTLVANTAYQAYIRTDCGGGDLSGWSLATNFTTPCTPAVAPFSQTFATAYSLAPTGNPSCWLEAKGPLNLEGNSTPVPATNSWMSSNFANVAGNNGFKINLYGTKNDWVITEPITLGTGSWALSYDMAVTTLNATNPVSNLGTHTVSVIISTDFGTTWNSANIIKKYTGLATYSNTGITEYLNLDSYAGQTIQIGFVATTASTTTDVDFHLDNIAVIVQCTGTPIIGQAASASPTTLGCLGSMVSLTMDAGAQIGGGITYQWSSSTDGTSFTDIAGATSSNYNIPEPVVNNTYYRGTATCYFSGLNNTTNDLYVAVGFPTPTLSAFPPQFCGTGGTSALTATITGANPYDTFTWAVGAGETGILSNQTNTTADWTITESAGFTYTVVDTTTGCTKVVSQSVNVLPGINPNISATPSIVCAGGTTSISSDANERNFSYELIMPTPSLNSVGTTTLANSGVATRALTSGNLDDGGWANIPLGFTFNFFGTNYTTCNVGTNGTVMFGTYNGTALVDFTFTTLPSASEPNPMIAVLAMDHNLAGATGGAIYTRILGFPGNRIFQLTYFNVQEFGDTKFSTAQLKIYEATGNIEVLVTGSTNQDRQKLVGVNGPGATIGTLAFASGTVASANNPIVTPFAFRFNPPQNYTTIWSPSANISGAATGTNLFSRTTNALTTLGTNTFNLQLTNQQTGCVYNDSVDVTVFASGSTCDDNNPCTVNDIIHPDCFCAGTFADADNDGVCDANDNCPSVPCDDNNPCTVNDLILADCSCAGTFADADNDGTCDANDNCAGPEAGAACNDNNPCTINDVILADCSCAGTFADADNDGTCDANDICAGPEAGAACNDNDPCTINDIILADCSCAGTFADSDNDGTCDASEVCEAPIAANIPQSITINCNESIPPFSPEFYMLDGTSVIVTQKDSILSEGCLTIYIQKWIARNQCNDSTIVSRIINVIDTTPPALIGCQSPIYLSDVSELGSAPTVNAIDNCSDNVQITFIESCVGCTEQGTYSHNLYTSSRPIDNPCAYPYDWAFALYSLPSNYRWYQLDTNIQATLVYNNDSTITLSGRVFNVIDPTGGFDFSINGGQGKTWTEWNSDMTPSGFKADCGAEDANFPDWMYYIIQPTAAVEMIGWGSHAGSLLNITHAPSNNYFAFQIGDGANNYNDDYGAGSWFNYNGIFLYNGEPVSSGPANGTGGFVFRVDNYPNPITRTWNATDCAGNTSTCSQEFIFQNCNGLTLGSICNDNNPCTVNDIILADCSCAGTFADADNDGTCDANDNCAGPEAGAACNDNNPCTTNDIILADCSCAGTFADTDSDGTCDANDLCAGLEAGAACNDNNPCTINDIILADCSCAGTFADADNDGTCDANDLCAGAEPGSSCDDGDACTIGDVILPDCSCAGTFADSDNDGTCDANDNCAGPEAGAACNDNNPCTVNDIILADCSCAGTFADTDNDGTCDANDNCAGPEAGAACDDNDPCTVNDIILADCSCAGTFADADNDGTCDANDLCAGAEPGSSCDDGDACTIGDVILADCSCSGTFADADNDGTCDANDLCAGAEPGSSCDDNDPCTDFDMILPDCTCAGTFADEDNDGICDRFDVCSGPNPGIPCDDGNPCTTNDFVDDNCTCKGITAETAVSVTNIHSCEPYTWNGQIYTMSGNYSFNTQTVLGCDSIAQLVLTVGAPSFTTESMTACGSYTWNGTTYAQSGTYTYVTTNSTGCPNTATLNLTVNSLSIAPSSVTASVNNVSAGSSVTLTVQGGSLGAGASWKWYRSACGGSLIGTGPSITITANTTDTYFVRAEGSCNTSACASITINVLSAQCGPEIVSATATRICYGSSTTLSVLGTLYPGAIWRWRRNSCTGTIVGTGANLTLSPTTTTTYYVRAEGGTCGVTLCLPITIIVDKLPATPSVISGPINGLCNAQNITYTVTPVSSVQQYNWTVPPGVTIVSGQGTASVTVNFSNNIGTNSTNGNPAICVTAQNSCGISPIRCLSLTTFPGTPASISGPTAPCINTVNTYSCPAVFGAASYTWLVPSGWVIQSGQGTSSITVLCNGTAGNVRVRANNSCGSSTNRSLACAPAVCGNTVMPMQMELWPNPTSERVYFAHGDTPPDRLQIYDMLGRDVYNGSWIPEFDVSDLAGGIYFVRATSGGESVVKRMEVVR